MKHAPTPTIAALLLVATSAWSCAELCTELGCPDGDGTAVFELGDRRAAWSQELDLPYTFAVSWEAEVHSCAGTVAEGFACDSELIRLLYGEDDDEFIEAVELSTFPGQASLTITRDGEAVVEETYDVEAIVDFPNGESCGPECTGWSTQIAAW